MVTTHGAPNADAFRDGWSKHFSCIWEFTDDTVKQLGLSAPASRRLPHARAAHTCTAASRRLRTPGYTSRTVHADRWLSTRTASRTQKI